MAQNRTTHRSKAGNKLYAVRNKGGRFKDVQTYKRAHGLDVKRVSEDEFIKRMQQEEADHTLSELFLNELQDIYYAENLLTKALPKMAKAAQSKELVMAINAHLKETKGQIKRLDKVFRLLKEKPKGKKCEGMAGIVSEGEEMMKEFKGTPSIDAAIIAAAQKVEHYEIASYGTLRSFASQFELEDVVALLQENLDEEGEADKKLTDIALSLANLQAERS